MGDNLPFDITARLCERGQAMFLASVDGRQVTSERYTPGDGDERRRVAKRWSSDRRLVRKQLVDADTVADELDRLEQEALAERDRLEADTNTGPNIIERASYADGDVMAELAWNIQAGRPDFVVYHRERRDARRAEQVETTIGLLAVPDICDGIVTPGGDVEGNVLLPTDCEPIGAGEDALRADITAFIGRYVELPNGGSVLATEYVLLTWVHDVFDELPYIAFRTADVGRGKSRALETVGALCYRPLFVGGGSSAAATLRQLDTFGGTLVADEFDQKHNTELAADLNRILNQGFQKRRPLVKCDGENNAPRPFRCFGPKVFALRGRLGDDATESRTLSIQMVQRTRGDIPLSLPRVTFDAEALALRNRLLGWRFVQYGNVHIDPALADAQLEDRANQIGLPLLAVARTHETQQQVVGVLRRQQGSLAASRAETLAGEVFAAIVAMADVGDTVRPSEVAKRVNQVRADAVGVEVDKLGRQTVTPQRVGRILSGELELPVDARDSMGMRYTLAPRRMVQLAQRFGVALPEPTQTAQTTPAQKLHNGAGSQGAPQQGLTDAGVDSAVSVVSTEEGCSLDGEGETTSDETLAERLARLEDAEDLRDVHDLWEDDTR